MLKMYNLAGSHSGSSSEFWEENWQVDGFEESVKFMATDPLRPLFEKYLRPDSLMLEGGCGMGNYVAYYAARGYKIVGLDFALRALKTLHIRQPNLLLSGGDVSNMPFPDEAFDLYYSGGVVEHFEGGAEESLKEARRVLKHDGILLISVPYQSPLRRLLTPLRKKEWISVDEASIDNENLKDRTFFQYAYKTSEFKAMLLKAGLETIATQGYAVLWGLQDIPFMRREGLTEFVSQSAVQPEKKRVDLIDIQGLIDDAPKSISKRLIVAEDDRVPILGLGVKLMRWATANMMMYVCKRT